jgi:SAM-dependent methyltransferase
MAGWQVTALEPDPSSLVGAGAIRKLAQESGLPITVVEEHGETLPFDDEAFDVIYGRQVLHHAHNLPLLCREAGRALKPGGLFIATREHVISKTEDLDRFLANHPLHKFYGGENAYLLNDYISAIVASGLRLEAIFGPFDSEINYFPMTYEQWRAECSRPISRQLIVGPLLARLLTDQRHWLGRWVLSRLANRLSNLTNTPGRLYSFVAIKQ